ncbi:radical SAM protein [Candidatus Woesearchaeota archaeon]|jgi:uncharacterized protein|nr:radical SAM protein [Candidatus Woesearchaeota archaeon]MBT3537157.1 radical SAM protein [Candidatus Woesearchaeota archaeon]MBT4697716.1 radical SAM protein [Candidatus Woesearchaeota archaeon]MBT4716681.1 radical SAM protein [Candidatus Woesearchaeota archaeon]MBT7106533.1 radical SAM protein [Candidatus Woesearchaeota archaeon]
MKCINKTEYYSLKIGGLPKGCKQCVQGRKTVLFITGICGMNCFYCPISDKKNQKDVTYANEWEVSSIKDLFKEIELCGSKGVGITGGDPLVKLSRTCSWIKQLKKRFGDKFHVHLYTPLLLVNEKSLKKLHSAGLDEIRFHPDVMDNKHWSRLELAKKFKWDVGVEIPVVPGWEKETKKLIDYLDGKIKFLNLNELEIADSNANKLVDKGFMPKDSISYAVKDSEKLAKRLLKYCLKKKFRVHYCTCKLKDKVQLSKRIQLRAKGVAKKYDVVQEDGTLLRGVVYLDELMPGFDYEKRLVKADQKEVLSDLGRLRRKIMSRFEVPSELMEVDKDRLRILVAPWVLEEISKELIFKCALVQEYPTQDHMIVELEWLN